MADEELKEGLKEDAKQEALDLAEGVTKETIEHVFNFAVNAINKYGNNVLKATIPLLNSAKEFLLELADKINGKVDGVEG